MPTVIATICPDKEAFTANRGELVETQDPVPLTTPPTTKVEQQLQLLPKASPVVQSAKVPFPELAWQLIFRFVEVFESVALFGYCQVVFTIPP